MGGSWEELRFADTVGAIRPEDLSGIFECFRKVNRYRVVTAHQVFDVHVRIDPD